MEKTFLGDFTQPTSEPASSSVEMRLNPGQMAFGRELDIECKWLNGVRHPPGGRKIRFRVLLLKSTIYK
jgi:hypothetical protein